MPSWLTNRSRQQSWGSGFLRHRIFQMSLWRSITNTTRTAIPTRAAKNSSWWGFSLSHHWSLHHRAGKCSTWQVLSWAGSDKNQQRKFDKKGGQEKRGWERQREACRFLISLSMWQTREESRMWVTRPCWSSFHTLALMKTQRPKQAYFIQLNNPSSCPLLKSNGPTGQGGAGANEARVNEQREACRCPEKRQKNLCVAESTCT